LITVAPAGPDDVGAIAELAAEMDRFYGATELDPLDVRQDQISTAVFADPPTAWVLLAWEDGKPAGFAAYSFLWPAVGLTGSLYLKELYVSESARRARVGERLMHGLFELAVRNGCSRVEWTTDQDNPDAQAFYEALGIPVATSKLFYRIEGEALQQAADAPLN
jgi:GNAT superfamily N-acetyltransferase